MGTSSYLPLLAGLAAPLLVLGLVAAGRKASEEVQGRRGQRRPRVGALTGPKQPRKRLITTLAAVSAVLLIGAGVAFTVGRGVLPTQMKEEPSPTAPTADPRVEASPRATDPRVAASPSPKDPPRPNRGATVAKSSKPRPVAVSVMNAAGIQGLAAKKSEPLRGKKVKLKTVGTAPSTRGRSAVFYTRRGARHARRIGRLLKIRRVERATQEVTALGKGAPVTVVLGRDASGS